MAKFIVFSEESTGVSWSTYHNAIIESCSLSAAESPIQPGVAEQPTIMSLLRGSDPISEQSRFLLQSHFFKVYKPQYTTEQIPENRLLVPLTPSEYKDVTGSDWKPPSKEIYSPSSMANELWALDMTESLLLGGLAVCLYHINDHRKRHDARPWFVENENLGFEEFFEQLRKRLVPFVQWFKDEISTPERWKYSPIPDLLGLRDGVSDTVNLNGQTVKAVYEENDRGGITARLVQIPTEN